MWYLILSLLTIAYIAEYYILPSTIHGYLGPYVIKPIIYISIAIAIFLISKEQGLNIWKFNKARKLEFGRNPFEAALLIAGLQIALMVIAGLFFGLGKSPYSHTPMFIIINIFFVFSAIMAHELSRSYLIKLGLSKKYSITILFGIITVIFIFFKIPPNEFLTLNLQSPALIAKFIGETIVPLIAMGLFATYLVYIGGAYASIGYLGALQAFHWFSPILPNYEWGIAALIGTIVPTIGYIIIQNSIQTSGKASRRKIIYKKDPTISWIGVALICVVIIFFSTGFFGVQPSVIYSGSMRDTLDIGDLVLVSKTSQDEIKVGDIIQFKTDNMIIPIIHRVYEIKEENGDNLFITKGDANDIPDKDPIVFNQIQGKVGLKIPKIGWISIYAKDIINQMNTIL